MRETQFLFFARLLMYIDARCNFHFQCITVQWQDKPHSVLHMLCSSVHGVVLRAYADVIEYAPSSPASSLFFP